MEKLDHKHFTNTSTETIQGNTDKESKHGKENEQNIYRNTISKEIDHLQEQESVNIVKVKQLNNFDVPDCDDVDEKNKVLSKNNSEKIEQNGICFERQSLSDCESIKTEEFEDIISKTDSISDCELIGSQESSLETVSLTGSESINTEETNELAYESYSISVCESIKTIDTDGDNNDEEKYFSDTGSISNKNSESVWSEDESHNDVNNTHHIRSYNLDADKIFNNIFKENHAIYNIYYLHSKKWLRNLFQETKDITIINDRRDFYCYQQLKESIFDKVYANFDKIYQQKHLQAILFWKKYAKSLSQYTLFFKCLGQSLAQTFCSINV
ncbi:hypothetical protein evm_012736 [Chilo suppressalis]|nr:hypothetical protein evm_012736 [Chilo suppressalis]